MNNPNKDLNNNNEYDYKNMKNVWKSKQTQPKSPSRRNSSR